MDYKLICAWLGLSPDSWPPNHYELLGLDPGESDLHRIEHCAIERHEWLRRYQLAHPDLVTEAMNRLAQAVDCLTNAEAKKAYDSTVLSPAAVAGPPRVVEEDVAHNLVWGKPPPMRRPGRKRDVTVLDPSPPAETNGQAPAVVDTVVTPAVTQTGESPALEAARQSATALRSLRSKRALYQRLARTRKLLDAWDKAGRYLGAADRPLTRKSEATELVKQMGAIRKLVPELKPLLGEIGQPGYLVVSQARLPLFLQTFVTLLPSQRERLAQDWQTGRDLLAAHRDHLRQELRGLRRKSGWALARRALNATLVEHPAILLAVLALVALFVAFQFQGGPLR